MFYSTLLLAATAFTGLVSAQNYSTSGNLTVVPSSVDPTLRQAWCRAQQNSCPQICGGQAYPNTCDSTDLTYTCTCTNGNSPNISDYDQTIPSFECAQWRIDCTAANPNDLDAITNCQAVVCGSKNASSGLSSSSTASMSASMTSAMASSSGGAASSASATGSAAASSGSEAASTASSSAAAAASSSSAGIYNVAVNYGTGILATAMLAVFGLAL